MNFNLIRTAVLFTFSLVSISICSQDLIARQAPIDRKLRSIDSLALRREIRVEQNSYKALSIYPNWNNNYVNTYKTSAIVPEKYTFDLRGFYMPTPSRKITSPFAMRWGRMHTGLDVKVNLGDTIHAAFDGKVRVVKYEPLGYGKYVVIRHNNGLETVYGHLSAQLVYQNQVVRAGQPIGLGGSTGRSTGSHLHFETRFLGIAINPALMFDFPHQDVTADFYTYHKFGFRNADNGSALVRNEKQAMRESQVQSVSLFYKVHRGDTLYRVARERGISVDQLCKLNGLIPSSKLKPGQVLRCS